MRLRISYFFSTYQPFTAMLKKSTIQFLSDLKANNNRDWFQANKQTYQAAKTDFHTLVQQLIDAIGVFEPAIGHLAPKNCVFRINRDVRFSKDKSPYKSNFGANIVAGGKKSGNAGYYLHIEPSSCFIGGGKYMITPAELKKIRQEIGYNPDSLKNIINDAAFKAHFGELQGQQLKTAPKGYPKDHPEIKLLRYKNFYVSKNLSPDAIFESSFVQEVAATLKTMKPLNDFFNQATY